MYYFILYRGHGNGLEDAFRKDYSGLAELRSILKRNTPFIVLTATARENVRNLIIKDLAMKDCVQLVTVPNKPNIRFSVTDLVELNKKHIGQQSPSPTVSHKKPELS